MKPTQVQYQPWGVVLSYFIASYASYVALDLAKRVRSLDRKVATGWWAGGSVAMGTGIWAMHFVGMLSLTLPFAIGYDYLVTALSWVAAVGVSAIALYIARRARLNLTGLATGALTMGFGICAMHYAGMAAAAFPQGSVCLSAGGDLITGAEALVRWQHPQRGLLGPVLFIPVAERFGLISALWHLSGVRAAARPRRETVDRRLWHRLFQPVLLAPPAGQ